MQIDVPDLSAKEVYPFCEYLNKLEVREEYTFNFKDVHTCDPFPMLIVSSTIRRLKAKNKRISLKGINANNGYAQHMGFFTACGIPIGKLPGEAHGSNNYLPIQSINVSELQRESKQRLIFVGDVIEERSNKMAGVLSRGDRLLQQSLTFLLREMIRNVPEHSNAGEVWICAQYWPSYQLVELALLDEGIGIKQSLKQNNVYRSLIKNDAQAIKLALQPGISRTFSPAYRNNIDDDYWNNSGYGLYMASELCANLGGDFIIASGNSAIRRYKYYDRQKVQNITTCFNGTAIQLRINTTDIPKYEQIKADILRNGENIVRSNRKAFLHASQSSRGTNR